MTTAESPSLSGMKYAVERILASDAPATVMLVSDPKSLSKRYVVKRLAREDEKQDPTLALAQVLPEASSKLNHAGALAYHDFALKKAWFKTTGGELLMDYLESKSLDKLGKNLSVQHWVLVFRQIAAALAHLHRRKVLHGNLEPAHVLLGRTGQVKLINYGLNLVEPGQRPTPSRTYGAPEVLKENKLIESSDVYSLGCLMYALLTGKSPSAAKKSETEGSRGAAPAAINPNIPASLSNLIVHCMKSHATNRPQSPYDVLQELEPIAAATRLDDDALAGLAFEEA